MASAITQRSNTDQLYYDLAVFFSVGMQQVVKTNFTLLRQLDPVNFTQHYVNRTLPRAGTPYQIAELAYVTEEVNCLRRLAAAMLAKKGKPPFYSYLIVSQFGVGKLEEISTRLVKLFMDLFVKLNYQDREVSWIHLKDPNRDLYHPLILITERAKNLKVNLEKYKGGSFSKFTQTLSPEAMVVDLAFGPFKLHDINNRVNQDSCNYRKDNKIYMISDYNTSEDLKQGDLSLKDQLEIIMAITQAVFQKHQKQKLPDDTFKNTRKILEPLRALLEKQCQQCAPHAQWHIHIGPHRWSTPFLKMQASAQMRWLH